jgi:hypothetical protein
VRYNPIRYVDPSGLVLFAFDGTGNTNNPRDLEALGNGRSNVIDFFDLYNDTNGSRNGAPVRSYMTGVGTRHRELDERPAEAGRRNDVTYLNTNTSRIDQGINWTGYDRIRRMVLYFRDQAELFQNDTQVMDVDIVGFSRGAAQAREFASLIIRATRGGFYQYEVERDGRQVSRCQAVNFRFMGLWDTVLSTSAPGGYNQMGVSGIWQHVAHATALNEHRGDQTRRNGAPGAFPLESIHNTPGGDVLTPGRVRIERGFIGAHANIGGGYLDNEDALSRVAFFWMIQQARAAGVAMQEPTINTVASSVVMHDMSDNIYCPDGITCPDGEDRRVRYRGGATVGQRDMQYAAGMNWQASQQGNLRGSNASERIISYRNNTGSRRTMPGQVTADVNMSRYLAWLRSNGYDLGNLRVN